MSLHSTYSVIQRLIIINTELIFTRFNELIKGISSHHNSTVLKNKFISCFSPDPARVRKTRHNRELQRNGSRCKCSSRPASPCSRADRQRPKQKRFKCVNLVFTITLFRRFSTWGTQIVSRGHTKYHNLCE